MSEYRAPLEDIRFVLEHVVGLSGLAALPGFEHAEFVRLGQVHRNTFINSPTHLDTRYRLKLEPRIRLAGQITGVEGYLESAATGLLCGLNAARRVLGQPSVAPPATTALGSLLDYVTDRSRKNFQPMNANFGLFPPLGRRLRGRDKKRAMAERALADQGAWIVESALEDSRRVSETTFC